MSTPWEVNVREMSREARRFLRAIGRGLSLNEAAERAGVPASEARTWLSDERFKGAYIKARAGRSGRGRVLWAWTDFASEEQLREAGREHLSRLGYEADQYGIIHDPRTEQ